MFIGCVMGFNVMKTSDYSNVNLTGKNIYTFGKNVYRPFHHINYRFVCVVIPKGFFKENSNTVCMHCTIFVKETCSTLTVHDKILAQKGLKLRNIELLYTESFYWDVFLE